MFRKGGTVSMVGVYGARYNMFPLEDFLPEILPSKWGSVRRIPMFQGYLT